MTASSRLLIGGRTLDVAATFDAPPVPDRSMGWHAIDRSTYDGAPDSRTRNQIGRGPTQQAAIDDLVAILTDAECQ
jgi:hypothetical protein